MNSKVSIALFIMYVIFTQATPITPSTYTFIVDSLHMVVYSAALYLTYLYYNSLPESHKTVLHEIMMYLIVFLSIRSILYYIMSVLINLFPNAVVSLLYTFPNIFCFIAEELFNQLAALYVVIIVILRAALNAFSNIFLNINDALLMKGVWILTIVYIIEANLHHYLQNYSLCYDGFIERLLRIVELEIDETKVNTFTGLSPLSSFLILLAPVLEIMSQAIIKIRAYRRAKEVLVKLNKINSLNKVNFIPNARVDSESQIIHRDTLFADHQNIPTEIPLEDKNCSNETDDLQNQHSVIVHHTEINENQYNNHDDSLENVNKRRMVDVLPVSPQVKRSGNSRFSGRDLSEKEMIPKQAKINEPDLSIFVLPAVADTTIMTTKTSSSVLNSSFLSSGIPTDPNDELINLKKITEIVTTNENKTSEIINADIKKKGNSTTASYPSNETSTTRSNISISEGLVGFNIIIGYIILLKVLKTLSNLEIQGIDKSSLEKLYIWVNYVANRLVNDFLPIYWLLRKRHSREFAKRKLAIWKERAFSKIY